MISRTYISKNLDWLVKQYSNSRNQRASYLYSKLSILELCGWIEESMDDLVIRCAKKRLKNVDNITFIEKVIVKRNYGFNYKDNFRKMIISIIGLANFEKIEKKIDPKKLHDLESTLNSLKTLRDSEAHTHLKGTTKTIDSPIVTKSNFLKIYEGLKAFDAILKTIK